MAITKDNKILRYKRNTSALQKVWNYIRRNRVFRFGDVMMVVGVRHDYLRNLLWHLEGAGYVECEDALKTNTNSIFRVIRITGTKSPSIVNGVVYDYNTDESFSIKRKKPLEKILEALKDMELFTKEDLAIKAGISESSVKKHLSELKRKEIICELERVNQTDKKLFVCKLEKVLEIINENT